LHPATVAYIHSFGVDIEERLQDGGEFTSTEAHIIASAITECLTMPPHKVCYIDLKKKLVLKGFDSGGADYVARGLKL